MKFKELRMLIFTVCIFFVFTAGAIYFMFIDNITKAIIVLVLQGVIVMMQCARYTMKIDEDYMLIYVFKGIGILPILVDYKDVKDITLLSKHKLLIEHRYMSKVYIVKADSFYTEVNQKISEYKKSSNP